MSFALRIIMLAAVVTASSCVKFTGHLTVDKTITLYHESPRGNLLKRILPPNQYPIKLDILNDHRAVLVLDTRDGRIVPTHMELFDSSHIPTENGSFSIPSEETAQDYDIQGAIKTKKNVSDIIRRYEACHTYVDRYLCDTYCDYYGCRPVCGWRSVRVHGQRPVEFKRVTNIRRLTAKLVLPNTDEVQATLQGKAKHVTRLYSFEGRCRY